MSAKAYHGKPEPKSTYERTLLAKRPPVFADTYVTTEIAKKIRRKAECKAERYSSLEGISAKEKQLRTILLLKPRDLSPLEFRETILLAWPYLERYVSHEDPFLMPHRLWLWDAASREDFHTEAKKFGLLSVSGTLQAQKSFKSAQVYAVLKYLEELKLHKQIIPKWPRNVKYCGDDAVAIKKIDSWAVLYEPAGRPLVYCSYCHYKRQQNFIWDLSVMEALPFSKDKVVDLMRRMPPFYQIVVEYGDAAQARDRDSLAWDNQTANTSQREEDAE